MSSQSKLQYRNRVYLQQQLIQGRTTTEIATECNVNYQTIHTWLIKHQIIFPKYHCKPNNKNSFVYNIETPSGKNIVVRTSMSNLKKCHNCNWDYLFNDGILHIQKCRGIIHKNLFHEDKWFHNKKCHLYWIFSLNSFS